MRRNTCFILILCMCLFFWPMTGMTASEKVINVKDYGAIGDGVTNDTPAMLAAVRAASNGDTLYFPRGTYLLRNRIELKDHMKLKGDGADQTVLRWTNLPAWSSFIYGGGWEDRPENPRGMEISALTVDGNNIMSANSKGLLFHNTDHIYIHDIF